MSLYRGRWKRGSPSGDVVRSSCAQLERSAGQGQPVWLTLWRCSAVTASLAGEVSRSTSACMPMAPSAALKLWCGQGCGSESAFTEGLDRTLLQQGAWLILYLSHPVAAVCNTRIALTGKRQGIDVSVLCSSDCGLLLIAQVAEHEVAEHDPPRFKTLLMMSPAWHSRPRAPPLPTFQSYQSITYP